MKFISILLFLIIINSGARANLKAKAYAELPIGSYQRISNQLLNKTSDGFGLKLNQYKQLDFSILKKYSHANGDVSFQAKTHGDTGYLDVTAGNDSIFGQLPAPLDGDWILENTELRLFSNEATRPR